MYGLWLFKEIQTEYGYCKVEILRKGYSGSQIEIGALAANSLTISLENLSEITAPVGKSVCSFEIIDTEQIAYDDFFTPDATYYKVVVSTKVGAGAYVTRWSGYITPDFFAENLTYRTPISISARDNIGYLNDVDFDLTASSITVRELIQSAFRKIAADYPMSLSFVSQKQTADGILAIDATISTLLLKEMSWGEALETILHDLGLQMRWVDNNTIAVLDLSQIPEYYPTQAFNFIHSSGYREIAPAWRQLSQSQDYGLRENFFEGDITSREVSFVKEEIITTSGPIFSGSNQTRIKYYTPKNWISAGAMYTINPADFFNGNELFKGRIYFTGILSNSVDYSGNYMSWRQPVIKSDWPMRIQFNASNAVFAPDSLGIGLFPPTLFGSSNDRYQLGLKVNVLLHSGTNTYVLRQDWELLSGEETDTIRFVLPEITSNSTAQEEELTIDVNRIPYDGDLEFRIYGFYLNPEYGSNVGIPEGSLVKMVSYITDVAYTYETKVIPTGQDTAVQINELHNVKSSQDYIFGEVPLDHGGINAYAGGLFKADGSELYGFQRNADGQKYNLLELVGREIIHFNKDNYNRLSGTIKNLDKEPLMFNRLLVREGKTYYPYNCSLNVISNEMNITAMQEVEPYTTASFTEINSEVVTGGGATIGGGNNTVLQYSEEAGNAKRVIELDMATDEEAKDAYVIIDRENFPQAKKAHITKVEGAVSRIDQDNEKIALVKDDRILKGKEARFEKLTIPKQLPEEAKEGEIYIYAKEVAEGEKLNKQKVNLYLLTALLEMFEWHIEDNGEKSIHAKAGLWSDKWLVSGGKKGNSSSETNYKRLDRWEDYDAAAGQVLSALLGYELKTRLDNLAQQGSLDTAKLEAYLKANNYLTPIIASTLYAPLSAFNQLLNRFNDFLEGSDTDNIINNWKELEAFLGTLPETSSLAEMLSIKADASALEELAADVAQNTEDIATNRDDLTELEQTVNSNTEDIADLDNTVKNTIRDISTQTGRVDALATDVENIGIDVTNLTEQVEGLDEQVSDNTDNIATNTESISGITTRLDSTDNVLETHWRYIDSLNNTVSDNTDEIERIDSTVTNVTARLDEQAEDINSLANRVNNTVDLDSDQSITGTKTFNDIEVTNISVAGYISGDVRGNLGISSNVIVGEDRAWKDLEVYGNILAHGTNISGQASDRRLKKDIVTIDSTQAIEVLNRLNPIEFAWNDKANELSNGMLNGVSGGFLADEFEKIIPNSSRTIWKEYKGVDYLRVIPYLVSVCQAQQKELSELRNEVKNLKK